MFIGPTPVVDFFGWFGGTPLHEGGFSHATGEVSQFPELYAVPALLFVGLYAAGAYLGLVDLANDARLRGIDEFSRENGEFNIFTEGNCGFDFFFQIPLGFKLFASKQLSAAFAVHSQLNAMLPCWSTPRNEESQMVYLVASMMCIGAISGLSSQQTVPQFFGGAVCWARARWWEWVVCRESSYTWWETHKTPIQCITIWYIHI